MPRIVKEKKKISTKWVGASSFFMLGRRGGGGFPFRRQMDVMANKCSVIFCSNQPHHPPLELHAARDSCTG